MRLNCACAVFITHLEFSCMKCFALNQMTHLTLNCKRSIVINLSGNYLPATPIHHIYKARASKLARPAGISLKHAQTAVLNEKKRKSNIKKTTFHKIISLCGKFKMLQSKCPTKRAAASRPTNPFDTYLCEIVCSLKIPPINILLLQNTISLY